MSESLEAVTATALRLALDAASLRQQAIATNIANAGTPGYVPLAVSFEDQLVDARRALGNHGRLDAASLSGVQPALRHLTAPGDVPKPTQLDVEAVGLAQNAVQYQALLKGLNRHYQILSAAVSDGKK
ncbi:MAG TPA: flagellar basal body protein [Ramlibacter sp.]|nr:flagellar basal body protein [Ramlibacter sp.]